MRCAKFVVALCCVMSLCVACGDSSKAPAESAIKAASDAYSPIQPDARKYVPDQAKRVEDGIADAKAMTDKNDYSAALQKANGVSADISSLATAIASKKVDLANGWTNMSASIASMVGELKSRVDMLSKNKGLPAGVTKDAFDQAKADAKTADDDWTDALSQAKSGDFAAATAKATSVKSRVEAAMKALKMK